jgi:hypothetical protein
MFLGRKEKMSGEAGASGSSVASEDGKKGNSSKSPNDGSGGSPRGSANAEGQFPVQVRMKLLILLYLV